MKKHKLNRIIFSAIILSSSIASSQSQIVDSLFSVNGFGYYPMLGNQKLLELYKLDDEKYLACGNENLSLGPPAITPPFNSIIKFSECGKVDSSYGINGRFEYNYEYYNGNIEALDYFLNGDGSLFIAGEAPKELGNKFYRSQVLIKIDSSGILDSNFILNDISIFLDSFTSSDGSTSFNFVEVVNDDKILCAGKFESSSEKGILLARFNSNGSLDSSYHGTGFKLILNDSIDFRLSTSHRVTDNKILFVGSNQDQKLVTLRVNDSGIIDSSYGLNGFIIDTSSMGNGRYSKIDNNKLVIVSKFDNGLPSSEPINIKRFLPDGSPDTNFAVSGTFWLETATNQDCIGFDILEDHRIIFGILYQEEFNYLASTYILKENGELDSNIVNNGELISNFIGGEAAYSEVVELEDGRLVLAGSNYIQKGCILTRYSDSSLVPHLTFNGSNLFSGVNSGFVTHRWYFNGIEIENENLSTLEFTLNGAYIVTVVDTVLCGEYSDSLTINILNTVFSKYESPLIFPNPAKSYFITNRNILNQFYSLSDISGREIKFGEIRNEHDIIDCSDLNKGLYIFRLSSGHSCKVIID